MKRYEKALAVLFVLVLALSLCGCQSKEEREAAQAALAEKTAEEAAEAEYLQGLLTTKHKLQFREDGSFKILVMSDMHGGMDGMEPESRENVKTLVDREKPDLVLFTGDNTRKTLSEEIIRENIVGMTGYIESQKIPWAHVYGNHDCESRLSKEEQQVVYESYEYCISETGDEDLHGVGNYVLPIFRSDSDQIAFNVWCLDSGDYLSVEEDDMWTPAVNVNEERGFGSGYDFIRPNQINWYMEASDILEAHTGHPIPGLMAFHIPLQESDVAWENHEELVYTGNKNEAISSASVNAGAFAALQERGDIKAIVNGHDHRNDFMVEYCGIKLCQATTPSVNGYHTKAVMGGRVFVLNQDDAANIETYMSYLYQ